MSVFSTSGAATEQANPLLACFPFSTSRSFTVDIKLCSG